MPETRQYHLVPITPVFTGTGVSLGPEEYYIEDGHLVRFSTVNAIAAMTAQERRQLETWMDGAGMVEGIKLLRDAARRARATTSLYRLPVGKACIDRLASLNQYSQQAIQSMPHNLEKGNAYIPGTAIKGAIRTALLSGWLSQQPQQKEAYRNRIWNQGANLRDSRQLEEEILGGRMESDPFRYLTVRDVPVHTRELRVDSFSMVGRDGTPRGNGIAMFGERLISALDGQATGGRVTIPWQGGNVTMPAVGTVEIAIETEKRKDPRVENTFRGARQIQFSEQAKFCRDFYLGRLRAERSRFPGLYAWADPQIEAMLENIGIPLRIGRHSHFEAASIEGIRRGKDVQARRFIAEGSTRTTCSLRAGNDIAPMGWIWLVRA